MERLYADIKAQKDSLKAELDEIKVGATSNSGMEEGKYTSTIMTSCISNPALAYFPCSEAVSREI